MRLAGQVALVTGGGRGIGRAIALALAREGARVSIVARTQAEIDAVAAEIRATGGQAFALRADVTVASEVGAAVERTLAEFGRIDILVNNAGGIPAEVLSETSGAKPGMEIWEWPEAVWDQFVKSNLNSVFLCSRAVIPAMIAQGHGEIVNIASRMGRVPTAMGGGYAAAKHAVIALTQTLALSAAPRGIRVNAISPGMIDTPGQRRFLAKIMPEENFPPMDAPETVAAAVLFVLCDTARGMTGQSLDLFPIG
jgi:3-oxoacyl-[acyl-carrier protein] reductase